MYSLAYVMWLARNKKVQKLHCVPEKHTCRNMLTMRPLNLLYKS